LDAEARFEVIVQDEGTATNEAQSHAAPVEERLAKQVRALEAWYAAEFERRLTELTGMLKLQLQIQSEELQQHYERRAKTSQENVHVIATPHSPEKHLEEIKRTEALTQKYAMELERMVADDTVNLGFLLQMRNQQLEVKAYLRGLKFGSEAGQASTTIHSNHEII